MSFDIDVFFDKSRQPTLTAWATSISEAGFPISFPCIVDLSKHSGFLPALLGDEESGFELFLSRLDEMEDIKDDVKPYAPDADAVFNFNCHETSEYLTAIAAAAVLTQMTSGVLFDPQECGFMLAEEAISYAKSQIYSAEKEEREDREVHGKLSSTEWAEIFQRAMQRVHPDYRLSQDFKKRLVESIREDETGLLLSQNCAKIHDNYRHCFAILLTSRKLSGSLFSPFVLGSRFDHNSTIAKAYNQDYREGKKWQVAPKEWHSEYGLTVQRIVPWAEKTARSAEQFLFPLHINRLWLGANRITTLYRDALSYIDQWKITKESLKEPVQNDNLAVAFAKSFYLESPREDWDDGLVVYYNALRLAEASGLSGIEMLSYRQKAICSCNDIVKDSPQYKAIPVAIRHAAIFVRYIEDFLVVHDELPHMIKIIHTLKELKPEFIMKPTSGKRKRWWFW